MQDDSLVGLAAAVRAGHATPTDLVEVALSKIDAAEPDLGAFTLVAADRAQDEARELTAEAAAGHWRGPLHGVPVAVKDLFDVTGEITTAGSRTPPTGRPAVRDAAAVRRLRDAGAVVLGRTRTHEYAWGLTTQHEVLGGTRNPHDPSRVPGGSSGGSAAAVAAGVVALALGTDTAGSIRLPAAWCGLVGHKPSHGLVSLDGVVPLAPCFDHAGALVRTVPDARLALAVLTGGPIGEQRMHDLHGVRLGIPVAPTGPVCDDAVRRVMQVAVGAAKDAGGIARAMTGPDGHLLRQIYSVLQASEALAYHRSLGHWPKRERLYGSDVRARMALGESFTPDDVAEARNQLAELNRDVASLFETVDVLLQPVAGCGPSHRDAPDVVQVDGRPAQLRDQVLPYTLLASLCGLPACSIPAGLDADGIPVGVQVIGPGGRDQLVLDVCGVLHPLFAPEPQRRP